MIVVISPLSPGMAAKVETKKVWILSAMIRYTQGIFITRGGSTKAERDAQIQQIIERQEAVEKNPDWNPICIYPEGTQSNGTALLPFKKGAFVSMKAVTPMVINYSWSGFSPTWDSMTFLGQAPLMYSFPGTYGCNVKILPDFLPNKYLLEKHRDKGKDDWEIFAWAVRDIMARTGQFGKNEQPLTDKFMYK
jgi:1-acyl-sn-glycerol-3-phosphate acyltransferase